MVSQVCAQQEKGHPRSSWAISNYIVNLMRQRLLCSSLAQQQLSWLLSINRSDGKPHHGYCRWEEKGVFRSSSPSSASVEALGYSSCA